MFLEEQWEPAGHFTAGAASPWVVVGVGGCCRSSGHPGSLRVSELLRAAPQTQQLRALPAPLPCAGAAWPLLCPSMSSEDGT